MRAVENCKETDQISNVGGANIYLVGRRTKGSALLYYQHGQLPARSWIGSARQEFLARILRKRLPRAFSDSWQVLGKRLALAKRSPHRIGPPDASLRTPRGQKDSPGGLC